MKARDLAGGFGTLIMALGASVGCSPSGFADRSLIDSVRILASSADKPYAKPGDNVTVQVLAIDGRVNKPEPMGVWWLPFPCVNPAGDAYYGCFAQFGGVAGGQTAAAGSRPALKPGVDLTPILRSGASLQIQVPSDIITSHPVVPGTTPYGLVILFNFACAGHLELIPPDPSNPNPQEMPIGCFDRAHNALGPEDFVFGFTRVYAYEDLTAQNPSIAQIDAPGGALAVDAGTTPVLSVPRCTQANIDDCPPNLVGPIIQPPEPGREVWA
ncbi:MAG: hypothetical protein ACREJ3_12700, partial [Polyangiaceae bacterium]